MDVLETRYETFEELVGYCRRVAGAIGRVCLSIFGSRAPARGAVTADELADDLGVALQLTNILRDVREDAENGRVYLPGQDLRRFGIVATGPGSPTSPRRAGSSTGWLLAGALRGRPRPAVVRARDAARAPAGPPQRRLRSGDGGDLSPPAGAHRERARARAARTRLAVRRPRRRGSRPAPWPGRRRERDAGGGGRGRAGRHRGGARAGRRGRRGDARGGAPEARRGRLLGLPRGPGDGQRPARVPALLHGLSGAAGAAREHPAGERPAAPADPGAASRTRALRAPEGLAAAAPAPGAGADPLPAPGAARAPGDGPGGVRSDAPVAAGRATRWRDSRWGSGWRVTVRARGRSPRCGT